MSFRQFSIPEVFGCVAFYIGGHFSWLGSMLFYSWYCINKVCLFLLYFRKTGLKVTGWWFCTRAKQILAENHPDAKFAFFQHGSLLLKSGLRSVLDGEPTHAREPAGKKEAIQQFHHLICQKAKDGEQAGPLGK